jgi:SH3-like domain-containing protein
MTTDQWQQRFFHAASALSAGFALALGLGAMAAPPAAASEQPSQKSSSGLPLPRFASLKVDRVNLRQGPGTEYPTAWVFHRAGLPVEVLKEFEGWRQIRDAEGTTGWVQGTLLSRRRTAVVAPWDRSAPAGRASAIELKSDESARSPAVAILEAGVMASVLACDGRWCRVAIGDVRGYLEQARLWGVYRDEVVK